MEKHRTKIIQAQSDVFKENRPMTIDFRKKKNMTSLLMALTMALTCKVIKVENRIKQFIQLYTLPYNE